MNSPDDKTHHKDPESTKDALIKAGTELFAERGFDGAKVDAIARRAGVNKAMINYHFQGKEGLYQAILESTFDGLERRFQQLRGSIDPPDVKLERFVDLFVEAVLERPAFPVMFLRLGLSRGRLVGEQMAPKLLKIFSVVHGIISEGLAQGTFRTVDPMLTHLSLMGSLVFFFATKPIREEVFSELGFPIGPPQTELYVAHVKELFRRGLTLPVEADAGMEDDDHDSE